MNLLLVVLAVLASLYARSLTRGELAEAVLETPATYRSRTGRRMIQLPKSITLQDRSGHDIDLIDGLPRAVALKVVQDSLPCTFQLRSFYAYSRFDSPLLEENVIPFLELYDGFPFTEFDPIWMLLEGNDLEAQKEYIVRVVEMCGYILPYGSDLLYNLARSAHQECFVLLANDVHSMKVIIADDSALMSRTLAMIKSHLAFNFAPLEVNPDETDVSEISEAALGTLKLLYQILTFFVKETAGPAYEAIDAAAFLPEMLFNLLSLPDAREREFATVVLMNLFHRHRRHRREIAERLMRKFDQLIKHQEHFSFVYLELLALLRSCKIHLTNENDPGNIPVVKLLNYIFANRVMPLLAIAEFPEFSQQWTFTFLEFVEDVGEAIDMLDQYAFAPSGARNLDRDEETIVMYDTIFENIDATSQIWQQLIGSILQKAARLTIRPRLHQELYKMLFGEDSWLWSKFNVNNGTCKALAIKEPFVLSEVCIGLRQCYISFFELELAVPSNLLKIIDLWDPEAIFLQILLETEQSEYSELCNAYTDVDIRFAVVRKG